MFDKTIVSLTKSLQNGHSRMFRRMFRESSHLIEYGFPRGNDKIRISVLNLTFWNLAIYFELGF